jgi:Tfp pilus assembly protein PilV
MTLLEVMIALLIAAAGFGALMSALAQAKRSETRAASAERELALARALLEEACVGALPVAEKKPAGSGVERWTGVTNGMPWVAEIHAGAMRGFDATAPEGRGDEQGPLLVMDEVRVEVGRVSLSTVRW